MSDETVVDLVFKELKDHGMVKTTSDFSINWLNKSESYFRGLHSKNRHPGVKAIASCIVNLRLAAKDKTHNPKKVRAKLKKLATKCIDEILQVNKTN